MPYISRARYRRVPLSDPAYWVEIKPLDLIAAQETAQVLSAVTVTPGQSRPHDVQMDNAAALRELLRRCVTGWNLDDEQGAPIPFSRETIQETLWPEDQLIVLREAAKGTAFAQLVEASAGFLKAEPQVVPDMAADEQDFFGTPTTPSGVTA